MHSCGRRPLTAVLKLAPKTNRSALAEAIFASREISDEFLLDPLIDGRKLSLRRRRLPQRLTATLCSRFVVQARTRKLSRFGRVLFFRWIPGFASKRERVLRGYAILRKPPLLQKYPVAPRHGAVQVSSEAYRKQENRIQSRSKIDPISTLKIRHFEP